jgi:hypothetical protein
LCLARREEIRWKNTSTLLNVQHFPSPQQTLESCAVFSFDSLFSFRENQHRCLLLKISSLVLSKKYEKLYGRAHTKEQSEKETEKLFLAQFKIPLEKI